MSVFLAATEDLGKNTLLAIFTSYTDATKGGGGETKHEKRFLWSQLEQK